MFFFFNDTATTEIYTPFPTRRSSDLISREQSYLVLAQNSDELRPSGGYISTYGWMRVRSGRVIAYDYSPDRKSTRLNSSHANISYAVFCLKKKKYLYCIPPFLALLIS